MIRPIKNGKLHALVDPLPLLLERRRQVVNNKGNRQYRSLEEEGGLGRKGLLDPNDPFGDPFADDETPMQEKQRMTCEFPSGD